MRHFLEFTKQHMILLVFTALITIAAFGLYLIHADDVLTDTEFYIVQMEGVFATFEKLGRFGLTFSKKLFSTDRYIPFAFLFYMMLVMVMGAFVFDFCVYNLVMPEYRAYLIPFFYVFNGLFISCPIWVHQFYFHYQAFEVALALLLAISGAYWVFGWAFREQGLWQLLAGIGCMVWSFGTYQVLAPFYITVNFIFFLFFYLYGEKRDRYAKGCAKLILAFFVGLALYLSLSKLYVTFKYHMPVSQPDSYMKWNKLPFPECLENIHEDFKHVYFYGISSFSRFTAPVFLLSTALCIWHGKRIGKCRYGQYGLFLLAVAGLAVSPLLMTLLLGNVQILRAHLVYPLAFAAEAGMMAMFLARKRIVRYFVLAFCGIMLCSQLDVSNRYEQLTHYMAESDALMAERIFLDTEKLRIGEDGKTRYPLVFVGSFHPVRPSSYISAWEATGISFFEIDPGNVQGSKRIACMMAALGMETPEPTEEQYGYACKRAEDMPVWPGEGSCLYENGMVIVKLSEAEDGEKSTE